MSGASSVMAVKNAIGGGESFYDKADAAVEKDGKTTPSPIYASVAYNVGHMQMDAALVWDDDESRNGYKKLGLHLGYNTDFRQFSWDGRYLSRREGEACITVRFRRGKARQITPAPWRRSIASGQGYPLQKIAKERRAPRVSPFLIR